MYKLRENNFVLNTETGQYFDEKSHLWEKFQDWIAQGNSPEPILNLEELIEKKISLIKNERNKIIDSVTGDDRQKRLLMINAIKINRKRSKGEELTQDDENEDFLLNKLSSYIESVSDTAKNEIDWVSSGRTMQELESYNINSIVWPVYE